MRLPGDGWPRQAPFADAQRAMRLIRVQTRSFGIDPNRIGVMGFSAGGHLAAMTAAAPDAERYQKLDAIDGETARPSFAALLYPVITLKPPFDTTQTKRWLVGKEATAEDTRDWSVETHVSAGMPPVFLTQNADDPIAAIDNSLLMFSACRQAKVPCEMHVFEKGGHGFGMGEVGSTDVAWPALLLAWLRSNSFA
ncbi:alpha/beta hydrolase [Novosphingobium terrae]|uniref:alpha/beta hydrolase n=1 Tax=Novosphingobium terrae TaxID=2726189 RepID=UPI00197F6175|nr:alpha/beta hydrolase [Novosphingobium terrae]